ncbi:MAG: phosphatase PAP2 family protein [Caldisphaera sp.]|jgi:undecaprenyl-diphosphatase|nr:phosphatase PAP2 family protein [Caldisphaera sp.]
MKNVKTSLILFTIILAIIIILEITGSFNPINNYFLSEIKLDNNIYIKMLTDTASLEAFLIYMIIIYFSQAVLKKHVTKNAVSFIVAIIISMIATEFIKAFTGIPRPHEISQHWPLLTALINADYFSFPSGHTVRVSVFAFYITYVFNNTKNNYIKYLSWIYALAIMYTRLTLQVHWFSDLLAGIVLAVWSSLLVIQFENIWLKIYKKIFDKIKILRIY